MEWSRLVALSVGLILISAVFAKVMRPSGFVSMLRSYEFLPARAIPATAGLALATEAVAAALLLSGLVPVLALLCAAPLFFLFGLIGWRELRKAESGGSSDCGCLGDVLKLRHSRPAVGLNLFVAAICVGAAASVAIGGERTSGISAGEVLLNIALSFLLAATYWVAHYAITVVSELEMVVYRRAEEEA